MCYVVELSSLSKAKNFFVLFFLSVLAGGKELCFLPAFQRREFGLYSRRMNYSRFLRLLGVVIGFKCILRLG